MKLLDVKIGDTVYISKSPIGFTQRTWLGRSPIGDAGVLLGYIHDFEHYLKIKLGDPIIPVTVEDVFDIGKCKFVKIRDCALYIDSNIIAWADIYIYKWETISKIRGLDLQEAINLEKELSKCKVRETDTILGYKSL